MLDVQRGTRAAAELIDSAAITADLKALAETHSGRERELRAAVARRLKSSLTEARSRAEELLLKDRHGRRCAERLCQTQDEIIRILFEFAAGALYPPQLRSEAERRLRRRRERRKTRRPHGRVLLAGVPHRYAPESCWPGSCWCPEPEGHPVHGNRGGPR